LSSNDQAVADCQQNGIDYAALLRWRSEGAALGPAKDAGLTAECAAFLHHEARLLDRRDFSGWLSLVADDGIYWVPMDDGADPRSTVNIAFDDHRRLEDRITRLRTGFAHNQEPDRRMRHLISNVEAWSRGNDRRVMANAHVFEHRTGRPMVDYVVGLDYWLTPSAQGWRIKVKRAVLLNSLDGIELPTLL
jgi:benzoate/toluate 1,2-dioxygenase beta subunit